MRTYTIQKISGTPNWETVPVMPIDNLLWTDSIDITAQAQLCWDEDALYVRMETAETHIRAKEKGPMAEVYEDSCLELFFRPTERLDYFHIEVNPNRAVFLGFSTSIDDVVRLQIEDIQEKFHIQVQKIKKTKTTPKGWVLTYRVPFAFVRRFFPDFRPAEGAACYGNAYKCGDKTKKEHYLAWNPIEWFEPAYHMPEQFGRLIFGAEE